MSEIKISIVVPVYNVEKYLERCLQSLLTQTFKPIEIICIDDGSTDNSGKILKKYKSRYSNLIVLEQRNQGVSAARNKGIEAARGEYIAFVDSDDYVDRTLCEEVYAIAEKKQADMVVFGGQVFTEEEITNDYLQGAYAFFESNLTTEQKFFVEDSFHALMQERGSYPLIWNKIYKRELVVKCGGFSTNLALGEDEAFLFAIFPLCHRIAYTDSKYYHYLRNREGSATDVLVMNFEKRAISNLKMAEEVKETWKTYEILDEHENEFLQRYTDLLFDSVNSLEFAPRFQEEYAQQVFEFLNSFPSFARGMIKAWYEQWYWRDRANSLLRERDEKQGKIFELADKNRVYEAELKMLDKVIDAFGNRNLMKDDAEKKKTRKKKVKKEKVKKEHVWDKLLKNMSVNNIDNIYMQVWDVGFAVYSRLKNRYGEDCIFFTCAFRGIGDAFLTASFIEKWLEMNAVNNFRFLLGGNSEKLMIEAMFPVLKDRCTLISQAEHEWLRNLDRYCDGKTDFYFFHHYDYMQPHLQITEQLQGYHELNMKDMYLYQMGLPLNEKMNAPEKSTESAKIKEYCSIKSLKKGKTVIIAPYSTCLGQLPEEFWEPIVSALKEAGYSVVCNCSEKQKCLDGTERCFLEFKDILCFADWAGYFIGLRSGLCDVITASSCKMAVVYPYESQQWGDSNGLQYVGIKNMGLRKDVLELELKKENRNMKEIQQRILKAWCKKEKKES